MKIATSTNEIFDDEQHKEEIEMLYIRRDRWDDDDDFFYHTWDIIFAILYNKLIWWKSVLKEYKKKYER